MMLLLFQTIQVGLQNLSPSEHSRLLTIKAQAHVQVYSLAAVYFLFLSDGFSQRTASSERKETEHASTVYKSAYRFAFRC